MSHCQPSDNSRNRKYTREGFIGTCTSILEPGSITAGLRLLSGQELHYSFNITFRDPREPHVEWDG